MAQRCAFPVLDDRTLRSTLLDAGTESLAITGSFGICTVEGTGVGRQSSLGAYSIRPCDFGPLDGYVYGRVMPREV